MFLDADDCEQCSSVLEELENIDDDCNRHQIKFVKTQDFKIAEYYGITDFPVIVYFEEGVPNVYEGNLIVNGCMSGDTKTLKPTYF